VASSSLVADDRREVGIAYKDSVFTPASQVLFVGATTDNRAHHHPHRGRHEPVRSLRGHVQEAFDLQGPTGPDRLCWRSATIHHCLTSTS